MLRSLLRASAALAFAVLLAPAVPSAAPAPPPGLAYDEIVRVVVNATPPPPGNFQSDLAALSAPQTTADAPTPAPRKRGINLGSVGSLLKGDPAGAIASTVVSTAIDNAVDRSMGAMGGQFAGLAAAARGLLQPHLTRYAYWNGWERVEDTTAQTVTIRKCDAGQVIALDLAKKTYTVYDPNAEPTAAAAAAPPPPHRGRQAAPDPQQPGTAVADLSSATKSLGPLRIENQQTAGYDSTTTFATTQSTGSCRDGSASIETVQYLAPLVRPAVNACPVRRRAVPETAEYAVTPTSGGCRPTFTAHRSGPTPPASRLALYSLVTFGTGPAAPTPAPAAGSAPAGAGGIGFLTERGNLKTLSAADAALFSIPQGFTKSP